MKGTFLICLVVLLIYQLSGSANTIEIKASINSSEIGRDDVLIYTLTFKGLHNPLQPELNNLKFFKVLQTSRSSEFRISDDTSFHYVNFIYYLAPLKSGELNIPSLSYTHKGRIYKTQAYSIKVVGSSSLSTNQTHRPPPTDQSQQPRTINVQLKPSLSKRRVYVGELLIFKVLLYSRNAIEAVHLVSNQSIAGFWQEWFPLPKTIEGEIQMLEGKSYRVYEVRKVALFPTQVGRVSIPPLNFEITLVADSLSFFTHSRKIFRNCPSSELDVIPLPAEGSGLPVGRFSIRAVPDFDEVDINNILTVRLTILAEGNIKTLEIPTFNVTEYYKAYPHKVNRVFDFSKDGLTGRLEAQIPLSFKSTGLISFPSLDIAYFDPKTQELERAASKPFDIKVTGVKDKETTPTSSRIRIVREGEDIEFIKKGRIYNQKRPIYKKPYFYPLLLLPFLVNLLVLLKRVILDRWLRQSAAIRQKKVLNRVVNALKSVQNYEGISSILETFLVEKSGMGLSQIQRDKIEAFLLEKGVSGYDSRRFLKFKIDADSARFSPITKSEDQLKKDLGELIDLIKRIDKQIK